jgi:hypothetical protein
MFLFIYFFKLGGNDGTFYTGRRDQKATTGRTMKRFSQLSYADQRFAMT